MPQGLQARRDRFLSQPTVTVNDMGPPSTLDIVTLVVAIIGIATGIAALVWHAVEFSLTGARVRVVLRSALVGHGGALVADGATAWSQVDRHADDGFDEPAYAIWVVNRGRFPTTIQTIAIKVTGGISLQLDNIVGPPLPHRLDGGSSETWYMEARPVWAAEHTSSSTFGGTGKGVRAVIKLADGDTKESSRIAVLRFN